MTRYTNNTVKNIHTDQKLHMIEGSCWMCLPENQLTARLKIIQLTDNSEKILLYLAANQLQLPLCVAVASIRSKGVVGQERLGTAFPHLFHVLFYNEFKAVLKWLDFWERSQLPTLFC